MPRRVRTEVPAEVEVLTDYERSSADRLQELSREHVHLQRMKKRERG